MHLLALVITPDLRAHVWDDRGHLDYPVETPDLDTKLFRLFPKRRRDNTPDRKWQHRLVVWSPETLGQMTKDWRVSRDGNFCVQLSAYDWREFGRKDGSKGRREGFCRFELLRYGQGWSVVTKLSRAGYWFPGKAQLQIHFLKQMAESMSVEEHHTLESAVREFCLIAPTDELERMHALESALLEEIARHPIPVQPKEVYSHASFGKGYRDAMGFVPPMAKFSIEAKYLGMCQEAFYGGLMDAPLTHETLPIRSVDFTSNYPTLNLLLGVDELLCASEVRVEEVTEEVRELLDAVDLEQLYRPEIWELLNVVCGVQPTRKDVLPLKLWRSEDWHQQLASFDRDSAFYSLADLIASKLRTGNVPKLTEAYRFVPVGRQEGLRSVLLRGEHTLNPESFAADLIAGRRLHKGNRRLEKFLKIIANSACYGIFAEVDPTPKPYTAQIHTGSRSMEVPWSEKPGRWYFPPLAMSIPAGGRLLLAMLDKEVRDRGGRYVTALVDSMSIVSTEEGADAGFQALSWASVDEIRSRFDRLSPGFLKLVDDPAKQVWMYCVGVNRYRKRTEDRTHDAASSFELGNYLPPAADWKERVYDYLEFGYPLPEWAGSDAIRRTAFSSPKQQEFAGLKPFQTVYQKQQTSGPFDKGRTVVSTDLESWFDLDTGEVYDGPCRTLEDVANPLRVDWGSPARVVSVEPEPILIGKESTTGLKGEPDTPVVPHCDSCGRPIPKKDNKTRHCREPECLRERAKEKKRRFVGKVRKARRRDGRVLVGKSNP